LVVKKVKSVTKERCFLRKSSMFCDHEVGKNLSKHSLTACKDGINLDIIKHQLHCQGHSQKKNKVFTY
jgi:hypothetical protein